MTMHYTPSSNSRFGSYSLVKLISYSKWYHLEEILQRDDGNDQNMPVFDDRVKNRLPEEHILHLACQHQAPTRVVELLAKKFPQSVSSTENKGRYPIHIACAKGLNPHVINFLIKSFPEAAGIQDDYSKTPLHYVCESYASNFRSNPSNAYRSPDKSIYAAVSLLLKKVPMSANVEDDNDMNPIEYAIDNDIDIGVIKMMQHSSRDNWRTMKRDHGDKSHEELSQSITSLGSLNLSSRSLLSSEVQETKEDSHTKAPGHLEEIEAKVLFARTA